MDPSWAFGLRLTENYHGNERGYGLFFSVKKSKRDNQCPLSG